MSRIYYPQARAILQVIFEGFGDGSQDSPRTVIPALPVSMTVHKNSYKQPDSYEVRFDARDLEVDPALIRGGSLELFLFQVPYMTDDQRVVNRQLDGVTFSAVSKHASPLEKAGTEFLNKAQLRRLVFDTKPIIAGLFDETQMELTGNGRWFTISGQYYTAHLAKIQWPPDKKGRARRIPSGSRLDIILQEMIEEADPTGTMKLELRDITEAEIPTPGAKDVKSNQKYGIPVDTSTSYWDVMYKLATRTGLILFVDGTSVVLTKPRNLTEKTETKIRRMAWGENIDHMSMRRTLKKQQAPVVIVQGYDAEAKQQRQVMFPNKKDKIPAGIDVKRNDYVFVQAHGIGDPVALQNMAETRFNLLARPERTLICSTNDLKDMRGDDLLNLSSGDAVLILFDPYNREMLGSVDMSPQEKEQRLVDRGFNRSFAKTLAKHWIRLQALEKPLRVREITYEYGADSGISIEMELNDFIVIERPGDDKLDDFFTELTAAPLTVRGINRAVDSIGEFLRKNL